MRGDSQLLRHMVKGHLKTPNRTLPCNSVRQETCLSTSDHPQSHETRDLPGARSAHQPVRQKTTVFVQRMAQSSSTALVDELPGSRICLCPSFPLSRIEYHVRIKDMWRLHRMEPTRGKSVGDMLAKVVGSARSTSRGVGGSAGRVWSALLCSRDTPDPFIGTAQAPSSLLPASARHSVEPGMDDASHGPHVGKLETPHAPTPGPSGASL